MKILWISSLAWKHNSEYSYPVNGAGAVSGSLFQQSMIEGLEELGHAVDIISDYPMLLAVMFTVKFNGRIILIHQMWQ